MSVDVSAWPPLPSPCSRTQRGALAVLSATCGDHEISLTTYGGQLLSWRYRGVPIVFENSARAVTDGKTPYRGGTPICFPHFNKGTLFPDRAPRIPSHGPVRTQVWRLDEVEADPNSFFAKLSCTALSTDAPNAVALGLTVTYVLRNAELLVTATVFNPGPRRAEFQFALHSYFATTTPENVTISGLGSDYLDSLQNGAHINNAPEPCTVATPLDRVYFRSAPELILTTKEYSLHVDQPQFSNAVVWNPGTAHTLKDLDRPNFICLESAAIVPTPFIETAGIWTGSIRYRVQL